MKISTFFLCGTAWMFGVAAAYAWFLPSWMTKIWLPWIAFMALLMAPMIAGGYWWIRKDEKSQSATRKPYPPH